MIFLVAIGSALILGVTYQITQNIQFRNNQLSLLLEFGSTVKEWDTELSIGSRSKLKYTNIQNEVFYTNFLASLMRLQTILDSVRTLDLEFTQSLLNSFNKIDTLQKYGYQEALNLKKYARNTPKYSLTMQNLDVFENDLRNLLNTISTNEINKLRQNHLNAMSETLTNSRQIVLGSTITMVIVLLIFWLFLKIGLLSPLKILAEATGKIGDGHLGYQVDLKVKNELGEFIHVLNQASLQLKKNQDMEVKLQKLETIGQVAISVNHEINNPLMIIMGNAEILKKLIPNQDEKIVKKLNSIISECHRISEVTKKLREIKNPIIEKYVNDETTMIDLKRSS